MTNSENSCVECTVFTIGARSQIQVIVMKNVRAVAVLLFGNLARWETNTEGTAVLFQKIQRPLILDVCAYVCFAFSYEVTRAFPELKPAKSRPLQLMLCPSYGRTTARC